MNCISTRGAALPVSFVEAMLGGLAPDGGLYVPETWPQVSGAEIAGFAGRPYHVVAASILQRFTEPELSAEVITSLCEQAYGAFDHPAVTPLVQIGSGSFLLELFHGPSLAFKDLAMQLIAGLYDHLLTARGRVATIVCATSGDTGGAAVEAFRGHGSIRLVALFPAGRISEVQRRFMTTTEEPNIRAVAVDGDFDDCQSILKALFQDEAFVRAVDLAGVNSINLARIVAQSAYFFAAAAALGSPERKVAFAIPTGNFGDAYSAYAAARMGLPVEQVIVATNANDIVARALENGRYERGPSLSTQSPAMDIQVASNFERLWFECCGRDAEQTVSAFRAFAADGAVDIPSATHAAMRRWFHAAAIDEDHTTAQMLAVFGESELVIDPHTAVALAAARTIGNVGSTAPTVILSTAHPAKFPEAVRAALGLEPPLPPRVRRLRGLPESFDRLPADVDAVKAYVRAWAS
ncbi:MAG TPA: threonine synthase [Caulobacteraceae bacterium]